MDQWESKNTNVLFPFTFSCFSTNQKAQYKSTSEIRPLGLTFLRRLRIEKIDTLSILWIATPCAHILWSSLYEVWRFRHDQDASVGNQIGPNSTKWRIQEAIGKAQWQLFLSPSGDLGIGLVWDNRTPPDHISVRLLKSSSNWTKSSMMGPQLFLGWYQMILDVQTRFRVGSD